MATMPKWAGTTYEEALRILEDRKYEPVPKPIEQNNVPETKVEGLEGYWRKNT